MRTLSLPLVSTVRTRLAVGGTYVLILPCSEVCMAMRIDDAIMAVTVLPSFMAQIHDSRGYRYGAPILHSEAGIITNRADVVQHDATPHDPGTMFGCAACDARCVTADTTPCMERRLHHWCPACTAQRPRYVGRHYRRV